MEIVLFIWYYFIMFCMSFAIFVLDDSETRGNARALWCLSWAFFWPISWIVVFFVALYVAIARE